MAGKSEKYKLTKQEELDSFNKLLNLNPNPGIKYKDYLIIVKKGHYKICLYKWFTGLDDDIYVTQSHLYKHLNDNSNLVRITPQIYYDIIVLGLTDISQRPKCTICGNSLSWSGFKRGYGKTCSEKCYTILRDNRMSEQGKNNVNILNSPKSREKQRISHKGWIPSEEYRIKQSRRMKEFYKTEKGKEYRRKSSILTSERNIN